MGHRPCVAYCRSVHWDGFFDDLEDQLHAEREAERAVLDSEAERLRLSRLCLADRLRALSGPGAPCITLDVGADAPLRGRLTAVGVDWAGFAAASTETDAGIVPLAAVRAITVDETDLLASAHADAPTAGGGLRERMTLGFVLRDVARRRTAVTVHVCGGKALSGTLDRALGDHVDIALHDVGAPRRAAHVHGVRMVPTAAVAWIRLHEPRVR